MLRLSLLLAWLYLAHLASGATRSLPLGNPQRGSELFRRNTCIQCHSINQKGGATGPDLAQVVIRGFSPNHLAAALWNHAAGMWSAWQAHKAPRPAISQQDAADLFTYLYISRYFESAGDAKRGRKIFRDKGCSGCHGLSASLHPGVQPVTAWRSLENPVALAEQMWNHSGEMRAEVERRNLVYPKLAPQEMSDLLVYLRSLAPGSAKAADFPMGSPDAGRKLLAAKGCLSCHQGLRGMEARPTRHTLADFTSALWNHPFAAPRATVPLSYEDMRDLLSYLIATQFVDERGDANQGRRVYQAKRCGVCHDQPSSGAPPRAAMTGRMNSLAMAAAVWTHGPAMLDQMKAKRVNWPRINPLEMADLTAFLHGPQFRQRRK